MSFRRRIAYCLVHGLGFTNRGARIAIASGQLLVGGEVVTENVLYDQEAEVVYQGRVLKAKRSYRYVAYYKPRGIETTYNAAIEANLLTVLPPELHGLAYAGRLDKESEGLLLLTDDGKLINSITDPGSELDKEYEVEVDKPIDEAFVQRMQSGVEIMGTLTRSCMLHQTGFQQFRIILTEGKNRQIRRMCYKLGYEVLMLKRVRIGAIELGALGPGEFKELERV